MPTWNGIISSVLGFIWALIVQVTVAAVFGVVEWALSLKLSDIDGGALSRVDLITTPWGMPIAAVMLTSRRDLGCGPDVL